MRPRRAHVRLGRLRREKSRRQQPRRRIVHIHDQRANRTPVLEPLVRRTVDLHQVPHARAPRPPRMRPHLAPRLGAPQSLRHHPLPQRLRRQPVPVLLHQLLTRQRRPEVRVAVPHQGKNLPPNPLSDGIVRPLPAMTRHQPRRTVRPVPPNQPLDLTHADPKPCRRLTLPQTLLHHGPNHTRAIRFPVTHRPRSVAQFHRLPFEQKGTF